MTEDIRHALRTALAQPGYFAAALLTLAVAIGFNTAIFTVVNTLLLRGLPYPDAERLVIFRERHLPQFPEFSVAPGNFLTWQAQAQTFDAMAAHRFVSANVDGGQELEQVRGAGVSTNFFDVFQVRPLYGRTFRPDDEAPGVAVVVLSHQLWQRRFGADAGVVGRTIRFGTSMRTVVGVLPPGFGYPTRNSEFWIPLGLSDAERRNHGSHYLGAIGRLKRGVPVERARQDLGVIAARLSSDSRDNSGWEALVFPMQDYLVRDVRRPLLVLLGAVGFVLLIACVNVANLLLARGASRRREFAIRGALGAARGRLVRQLISENLLLGAGGAAGGLLLGGWLLRALLAVAPPDLPRASEIGLDLDVLLFALLLAVVTPLVFGLVPVVYGSRPDLRDALAAGGRQGSVAPARRLRTALVISEVAIALMLLAGAGLLIRSFAALQREPLGFEPEGVVIGGLALPGADYPTPEARLAFLDRLTARIAALGPVSGVGLTQSAPMVNDFVASFEIEGSPSVAREDRPRTNFYAVTPGYLQAMGIRLVKGRGLTATDTAESPHVVVINETLARRFFGDSEPLGRRIRVSQGPSYEPREIVGVVTDVKQYGIDEESPAQVYEPYARHAYLTSLTIAVRTRDGDPAAIAPDIRAIVRDLDRNQAVARLRPMMDVVDADLGSRRFAMLLLSIFAVAAVALAAMGLYAVLAYSVGQRRQEIAIRIAHGATRGNILRMVVRGGFLMTLGGVAIGLTASAMLRHLIESMLFNVRAGDPATHVAVVALLFVVAIVATLIPAYRATRVDPIVALRDA